MKQFTRVVLLVLMSYFISACGGGGGGGGGADPGPGGHSIASLQGSWYGTMRDTGGTLHTVQIFIDGSGNVTSILQDNVSMSLTGVIDKVSAKVFGLALSDGTDAGFIVDASGNHAGFLDDGFFFGALQKGASSIPSYVPADIIGSWTGYGVTLDSNFVLNQEFASSATVNNSFLISGSDGLSGAFSGQILTYYASWGVFQGNYSNGSGSGTVTAFLSADKSFAASYACDSGIISISNCSYTAWNK